jgi:putative phage-type endonuclease
MIIHQCEQRSPEWFKLHRERMTGSHATAIGNAGKGLETYCKKIVYESISTKDEERFKTKDTERGNELEPIARKIYEMRTGNKVIEVGFIEQDEFVGVSPDGFINEDGGLEIKSPDDKEYFEYLLYGKEAIDSIYHWQIQMNLLVTNRKWWDLAIYNPNFKNSIQIYRIEPDKKKQELLLQGFEVGKNLIKQYKEKICI